MKKNMIAKKFFAGALALTMAFTSAVAFAPAAVAEAATTAETLAKPEMKAPELSADDEGKLNIRFYWNNVEGADKFECQISYDYDKNSEESTQFIPLETTESLFSVVTIPDKHGAIAIRVAARNGSKTSGFATPVVVSKKTINKFVKTEKNIAKAASGKEAVLVKKAKSMAKNDKSKGYSCRYNVCDLNGDKVMELFYVKRSGKKDTVSVYTVKNGKAALVKFGSKKSLSGVTALKKKGNQLVFKTGKTYVSAKMSKGKFNVVNNYKTTAKKLKKYETFDYAYKKL